MSDDLVKRLREGLAHYAPEAADRIEELEAELRFYRYEVVEKAVANEADALDLWKASQAENARLRRELEGAAELLDDYSPLTGNTIETSASKRIRAVLQETDNK